MTALDVAAAVGTIGAAGLALLSIEQNRRQARKAERARHRELRAEFFLERLLQLSEGLEKGPTVAFANATVQLQLRMLPASVLPLIRVKYAEGLSEAAVARWHEVTKDMPDGVDLGPLVLPYLRRELVEAVSFYLSGDESREMAARRDWRRLWMTKR